MSDRETGIKKVRIDYNKNQFKFFPSASELNLIKVRLNIMNVLIFVVLQIKGRNFLNGIKIDKSVKLQA